MALPNPQAAAIRSVLIVDDSALQRSHGVDLCRESGVAVVHEASNGREALELLETLSPQPDLLLIDLEMPTMDGPQLLTQLRARNIDIPVIVASTKERSLLQSVRKMGSVLGLRVLGAAQKPLTLEGLTELLRLYEQPAPGRAKSSRRKSIAAESLQSGIENGELDVYYHPKMDVASGAIRGVEALARWRHPDLGMILPDEFIPLAEQHNLIHKLTLRVMNQAMLQCCAWQAEGHDLTVAINLSPVLLDRPDLVEEIVQLRSCYELNSEKVIFEITESSLLRDLGVALSVLTRLRLRGFGLSLDDYGTGFASMQQLAQIPFTELKIDRSFVRGACQSEPLKVMLSSAVEMAKELGLVTVAEGVETQEELQLLREYGCTYAQGWLIAKPMPSDDLLKWLVSKGTAPGP